MKVAPSTALIFAVLLAAAIANAQFVPQQGIAVGEPYGANPLFSTGFNSPVYQPYIPMYLPNSFSSPYMSNQQFTTQPLIQPYNYSLPTQNYTLPPYNYGMPAFTNPYNGDDFTSRERSDEDEEERREREEARREEREERREEKRREREERKREERLERERARRGEDNNDEEEVAEPNPKSEGNAESKKVIPAPAITHSSVRVPKTPPAKAEETKRAMPKECPKDGVIPPYCTHLLPESKAAPAKAEETNRASVQAAAEPKHANWWETDPGYQKYLKDKKAYEESQKKREDWPPKPKPVSSVPAPTKEISTTTGPLAASARCNGDCPPEQGPLTQQIVELKELADPREVSIFRRPPDGKVSEGIRTVINTIYQSCDAYNSLIRPDYCQEGFVGGGTYCAKSYPRKTGDLTAYDNPQQFFSYERASQPGSNVLTPIKPEGPQCRDMNKTPPVFKWGGRPVITKSGGKVTLNLFNDGTGTNKSKFVTLDCSGYVSAVYTAAGLNLNPNSPGATATTYSLRKGEAKCLSTVSFAPNEGFKSGDIIVFPEHSLIVDRAGSDPFSLNEMPALPSGVAPERHCLDNLRPSQFDFVISQSGVYGGRMAVSQSRAVDYIANAGGQEEEDRIKERIAAGITNSNNSQLVQLAIDACVAKLTNTSVKASRPKGAVVLRHKGSAAAGCVTKPAEVVGNQCVKGCP